MSYHAQIVQKCMILRKTSGIKFQTYKLEGYNAGAAVVQRLIYISLDGTRAMIPQLDSGQRKVHFLVNSLLIAVLVTQY